MATGQVAEEGPLLITARQLADKLQISTRTLWRMLSAERLPAPIRVGGIVRWRANDIERWISAGCPEATARHSL
ncbi:MAG: helix-turn-helix domain-containing protein [Planctomycetes bacterium]|nr:helix-turn-helix domain-containing protein [Planctomycetota bacterium]